MTDVNGIEINFRPTKPSSDFIEENDLVYERDDLSFTCRLPLGHN